jgi:chromosome partitioning protein
MIRTIPVINNKGGVGKTTTTVNVAAGLARRNRRVLVVDLDSQSSASLALGMERDDLEPSAAGVLFDEHSARDARRRTPIDGLDLLPGSIRLADADTRLSTIQNRETCLARALAPVEETYDVILIDCAPSTSVLSINALVAADAFIIPVTPSYLSLEGVISLGKVVKRVRRGLGEAAPVLGVLLTMVRGNDAPTREIIEEVRNHYGGKVFDTEIRDDPAIEDAPGFGQSIFEYDPDSPGAADYRALVQEVIDRIDRYGSIYGTVRSRTSQRERTADDPSPDPSL